jgi:lipoprotein-releasing system permease protein
MRFELFVASRYLRAKRRQAVIGVITAISVAGVTAGVASLIIALAINNGFRQDLQQKLLGSTSHVQLLRVQSDGITHWQQLMARLEKQPHVVAAAPAIYVQAMISRGTKAGFAQLKGIIPADERRVSNLLETVKFGSAAAVSEPPAPPPQTPEAAQPSSLAGAQERLAALPPIVVGKDMAENIGATVGSTVMITIPQGDMTPFGFVPKFVKFKVVGIFDSGFYDYDSGWAFIRLKDAQMLASVGDLITVIEFKLDDMYRAEAVGKELEQAAGKGFMTANWMEQNKPLFHALKLERVVTFITIGLIVFVAALNILISLIMMVMEKTRDIAVLMSLGARKRQVRRVFVAQGVLIGVMGTALGLMVGFFLAWGLGHYHWIPLDPSVYSIDYVPSAPRVLDGVWVAAVALGVSFIATLYPSWSAARIYPAEALRYE